MSQNHEVLSAVVGCISSFSLVCLVFSKSRSFVIALRELKKNLCFHVFYTADTVFGFIKVAAHFELFQTEKTRKQQIGFLQL